MIMRQFDKLSIELSLSLLGHRYFIYTMDTIRVYLNVKSVDESRIY